MPCQISRVQKPNKLKKVGMMKRRNFIANSISVTLGIGLSSCSVGWKVKFW